jgi:hypothetical protein
MKEFTRCDIVCPAFFHEPVTTTLAFGKKFTEETNTK